MYLFLLSILAYKNFYMKSYVDQNFLSIKDKKEIKFGSIHTATKILLQEIPKMNKIHITLAHEPHLYLSESPFTGTLNIVPYLPTTCGSITLIPSITYHPYFYILFENVCLKYSGRENVLVLEKCEFSGFDRGQLFEFINNDRKMIIGDQKNFLYNEYMERDVDYGKLMEMVQMTDYTKNECKMLILPEKY